jgi:hypothetical protein
MWKAQRGDNIQSRPRRRAGRIARVSAAIVSLVLMNVSAKAQNAYCESLKAQIALASGGDGGSRAAAAKQQAELIRTVAYARRLGCERQQFLIFGEAPPPQCGQINARIAQMNANLTNLQQTGYNARKAALIARFDAQCRSPSAASNAQPRNFLEQLFGVPSQSAARETMPEFDPMGAQLDPLEDEADRARGGSEAICVRQCDGGFFPVSYSARRSNLDELNSLCRALCPNAEATLYTKSPWRDVDTAVSLDGDNYADHPNALKFQKTRVAGCGCKPPGKSWAEALEEAERMLAARHSEDVIVTPEQAERLSRPLPPASSSRRDGKNSSTKRDVQSLDAAAAVPATPPGALDAPAISAATTDQGVVREMMGPDGARRRVRVVAPTL